MAYTIYKPTTAVRGVLFDMDGVILDTEKLYTRFWLEGAHALGFPMTREQAIGLRGMNLGEAARMIGTYFGSPEYYQPIKNKRIELMDAYIAQHGVEPKAGIREILEYLKENHIPRAVCTASPIERVKRYLVPLGLFDDFDAICTAYDVAQGKPEPDIYLYGAQVLGKAPASCMRHRGFRRRDPVRRRGRLHGHPGAGSGPAGWGYPGARHRLGRFPSGCDRSDQGVQRLKPSVPSEGGPGGARAGCGGDP